MNLAFALIAFLKGKARLGAFGLSCPASPSSARYASPSRRSLWARRFYDADKLGRSRARAGLQHRRYTHLKHRVYDAIGGAPHVGGRADHTR